MRIHGFKYWCEDMGEYIMKYEIDIPYDSDVSYCCHWTYFRWLKYNCFCVRQNYPVQIAKQPPRDQTTINNSLSAKFH